MKPRQSAPILARLWRHIEPEPMSGCWIWIANRFWDGYGQTHIGSKTDGSVRKVRVHRLMYEHARGQIPEEMTLDHLCRVRACVNPAHLEVATVRENILRGESPSAQASRATHCRHGHSLHDAYTNYRGNRQCRPCQIAHSKRLRDRRAVA